MSAAKKAYEEWAQELKDFVEGNGNVHPQEKSDNPEERSLSFWLTRQRINYKAGKISEKCKNLLLETPGMRERFVRWEGTDEFEYPDPVELAAESGLDEAILAVLPADAPKGHEAYKKSKWVESQRIAVFQYPDATNGGKVNFQTTSSACGSRYAAERIARACYLRFEDKETKDLVLTFRASCYARLPVPQTDKGTPSKQKLDAATGEPNAKPAKQRRVDAKPKEKTKQDAGVAEAETKQSVEDEESEVIKELGRNGQLEGAVRMEGRDAGKKSSAINGIYKLIPGGFSESLAYEHCSGGSKPHFIFYSSEKKRWKVSNVLGDSKGGFAYFKTSDGSRPPSVLQTDSMWFAFDGKDSGYVADADMRCVPLKPEGVPEPEASADADGWEWGVPESDAASEDVSDKAVPAKVVFVPMPEDSTSADVAIEDVSDKAGTVGSSSSDSDNDDAAGSKDSGSDDSMPETLLPTKPAPAVCRLSEMVCAKMLVHQGHRCGCHYVHWRECPGQAGVIP